MNETLQRILTYAVLPYALFATLVCAHIWMGEETANIGQVMRLIPFVFALIFAIVLYNSERKWMRRRFILKTIGYGVVLTYGLAITNGAIQLSVPPGHLTTITADTRLPKQININIDHLDVDTRLGSFYTHHWSTPGRQEQPMKLIVEIYRPLWQRPNVWMKKKYETPQMSYQAEGTARQALEDAYISQFLEESTHFDWQRARCYVRQAYEVRAVTQRMRSNEFRQLYDSLYGAGSLSRFDLTQNAVVLSVQADDSTLNKRLGILALALFALLCIAFAWDKQGISSRAGKSW